MNIVLTMYTSVIRTSGQQSLYYVYFSTVFIIAHHALVHSVTKVQPTHIKNCDYCGGSHQCANCLAYGKTCSKSGKSAQKYYSRHKTKNKCTKSLRTMIVTRLYPWYIENLLDNILQFFANKPLILKSTLIFSFKQTPEHHAMCWHLKITTKPVTLLLHPQQLSSGCMISFQSKQLVVPHCGNTTEKLRFQILDNIAPTSLLSGPVAEILGLITLNQCSDTH